MATTTTVEVERATLTRAATTFDGLLHALASKPAPSANPNVIYDWKDRSVMQNDFMLRSLFLKLLEESKDAAPADRLIMYDACDEHEVRCCFEVFRKRLDARRNTKPKKPDDQLLVCTPFNPDGFHFGKIKNDRERIVKLGLSVGRYDVLTNKFPLFPKHMLLVAGSLVPQQMNRVHLTAIAELLQPTTFCAYFNSWCASASVNHFHCHVVDEFPPVTAYPLVDGPSVNGTRALIPQGFPGFCYVFPLSSLETVDVAITAMQAANQPHNLLFTPRFVYVFPKPLERPMRSFELYPETVGGPELIGSFTVYDESTYGGLTSEHIDELVRINTAPLPSRLLQQPGHAAAVLDDAALVPAAKIARAASSVSSIRPSVTLDALPSFPSSQLHTESWPQDRPIAKALARNQIMF